MARFDGEAVWSQLTHGEQRAIGAAALEWSVGMLNLCAAEVGRGPPAPVVRASRAATVLAAGLICEAVNDSLLGVVDPSGQIPLCVGRVCRYCGCTDDDACREGCSWVTDDKCSACVGKGPQ